MARRHIEEPLTHLEPAERVVRLGAEDLTEKRLAYGVQQWQRDNWAYYDMHGEVHYPFTVGGNLAGRIDIDVQERVDGVWGQTENMSARAAHEAVLAMGIDDYWRSVWLNHGVAGEGVLAISIIGGAVDVEVFSNIEVYQGPNLKWMRNEGVGQPYEMDVSQVRLTRFWRNHPQYRKQADSGLRSVANECKELNLLKLALLAKITSRLASVGILFLPNSISMPAQPGEAGILQGDPLVEALKAMFMAPILNPGGAAAAMPVILRGPDEAGEKIRHIILDTSLDETEENHRQELRRSIANGIELPIETQTSVADSNHWNAWNISESALADHVLPVCRAGANLLTTRLLWPWMRSKDPSLSEADLRRFRFAPNATRAALGLNGADLTRQLWDRGELSGAALRRGSGFSEADKPTEEEIVRWLGVKLNNPLMATWGLDAVIPPEVLNGPTPPGMGGFDAQEPIVDSGQLPGNPVSGLDQS